MTDQPICSIVIPSYCSAGTIGLCLSALLNQDFNQAYEIIVVDSSPDETPDIIRRDFPQVELIHLVQQTDPAQARNIGARQARGEIVAFIDSDCVAAPDWLDRLYTTLQAGYDAVGGAIANHNGETLVSWAGYFCEFREFLPVGPARNVDNLTLGNVAYRRKTFWDIGGFPAGYFPQEDQVFHRRLRQRGLKIRFDPQIIVAHHHRSKWQAFLKHQRHIGWANARVLKKVNFSGAEFARRRWLVIMALPALLLFRFIRTLLICRNIEQGLVWRQPFLIWLCWLGMCCWGLGFLERAFAIRWRIAARARALVLERVTALSK